MSEGKEPVVAEGGVPDGTPKAELTPEERVDIAIAEAKLDQMRLTQDGAGERVATGGGGGGQFVFANLAELDSVLAEWTAERDRCRDRTRKYEQAIYLYNPPAEDTMSHYQADLGGKSLQKARDHNEAMFAYAEAYVEKLTASRASMAATEQDNTDRLRGTGEDLGNA